MAVTTVTRGTVPPATVVVRPMSREGQLTAAPTLHHLTGSGAKVKQSQQGLSQVTDHSR